MFLPSYLNLWEIVGNMVDLPIHDEIFKTNANPVD